MGKRKRRRRNSVIVEVIDSANRPTAPKRTNNASDAAATPASAETPAQIPSQVAKYHLKSVGKPQQRQKSEPDWRLPGARCKACVPRQLPGRGRGLVATRLIRAGEEVASELPAIHWNYTSWKASVCSGCLQLADKAQPRAALPVQCEGCLGYARYCSKACSAAAAPQHSTVCDFYRSLRDETIDDDLGAAIDLVCGALSLEICGETKAARLVAAQSDCVTLSRPEERNAERVFALIRRYVSSTDSNAVQRQAFVQAAQTVNLVGASKSAGVEWVASLLPKGQANSYGLLMPYVNNKNSSGVAPARGAGCFPLLALINHGCIPNVARAAQVPTNGKELGGKLVGPLEQARLSFVALHDIRPGTEILTSYVNVRWPLFASTVAGGASMVAPAARGSASSAKCCPECQKPLQERAALVRQGRHVNAAAGYHCDGCNLQDPAYRCATTGCDFDRCTVRALTSLIELCIACCSSG